MHMGVELNFSCKVGESLYLICIYQRQIHFRYFIRSKLTVSTLSRYGCI
jgi:hypothetical protein